MPVSTAHLWVLVVFFVFVLSYNEQTVASKMKATISHANSFTKHWFAQLPMKKAWQQLSFWSAKASNYSTHQ